MWVPDFALLCLFLSFLEGTFQCVVRNYHDVLPQSKEIFFWVIRGNIVCQRFKLCVMLSL